MEKISGHIALFLSVDCFSTKEMMMMMTDGDFAKKTIAQAHILKKDWQKKIPQPPPPPRPTPPPPPGKQWSIPKVFLFVLVQYFKMVTLKG